MHAYLFVFEVEPMEVGMVYDRLPLHCTVMHWFRTPADKETVLAAAKEILEMRGSVLLTSEAPALFGKHQDIPVHRVIKTEEITSLHLSLLKHLETLSVRHSEPEFIGSGYNPHVTTHGNRSFPPGTTHSSENIYFVEALEPETLSKKMIVAKIPLAT